MDEKPEDKDPEPIKHTDAERVQSDEQQAAEQIEDDPAHNPDDEQLRDIKGG